MQRRALLAVAVSAITASFGGCIGSMTNGTDDPGLDDGDDGGTNDPGDRGPDDGGEASEEWYEWHHGVRGRIDTVVNDRVFGHEHWDDGDGGVYALSATTGEHLWTYGQTGGYTAYSPVTVGDDGVFFGFGDDAIGSEAGELIAVDFAGEERWTRETGSVYRRPRLGEDLVVVGSDDGSVYAFERASGERRWSEDELEGGPVYGPTVVGIADGIAYVNAGPLVALGLDDGEERWSYGDDIGSTVIDEEVAIVVGDEWVAGVEDGDERWREEVDTRELLGVARGNAVVRTDDRIRAFEIHTGERAWSTPRIRTSDDHWGGAIAPGSETVYAVGDTARAFDASDGNGRWKHALESAYDPITRRRLVATDEGVIVPTSAKTIVGVADGERSWSRTFDDEVRDVAAGDRMYVSTDGGIYGVDSSDN